MTNASDANADRQVLLVGGWAQPELALLPLKQQLATIGMVHTLVLDQSEAALQAQLHDVISQFPGKTLAVGWSLGGQFLLRALAPNNYQKRDSELHKKLTGIACIACNPYFIGDPGWPGIGEELFGQFESGLQESATQLLTKFYKLQLIGDPQCRAMLRMLVPALDNAQQWSADQLRLSLGWLRDWDCRKLLAEFVDITFIFGQQDRLIPGQLLALLAQEFPQHQTIPLNNMAHYPHADAALAIVQQLPEQWRI